MQGALLEMVGYSIITVDWTPHKLGEYFRISVISWSLIIAYSCTFARALIKRAIFSPPQPIKVAAVLRKYSKRQIKEI
jgi:hypothetical protein